MKENSTNLKILERSNSWLAGNYDEDTKKQIRHLMDNDPAGLTDAFYRDLEFGTGGLRGIMGAGTNRMNRYTVGMATQGLANYLLRVFGEEREIKAAIAYDNRTNNTLFAQITADVLSANGIKVYLFDALRPTPELSFAIRYLHCHTGIVITASHNPPEYNGYKVYWNDGGQLVPPHDKNIIAGVQKIRSVDEVRFKGRNELIEFIGEKVDQEYIKNIKALSLSPEVIDKYSDLRIVYTPLHGSGVHLVPMALKAFGFQNIIHIPEQDEINGHFPTLKSPNPEEPAALSMAIEKARESHADLVMGTDPDADRIGIAVRDLHNDFILLNGNQTASLLTFYLLTRWKEKGKLSGKEFIVKTIVTSELLKDMATAFNVETFDVLTGFKYIAELIRELEGQKIFIGGGEESYGYLIGDFVRDKDAVTSSCFVAEAAAWAASKGMTLYDLLLEIYRTHGLFREKLVSVEKKGITGAEEIEGMMRKYRKEPYLSIADSDVICIKDYLIQLEKDFVKGEEHPIHLPKSDVLQFFLADGSKITVRPSGTEPKIKFYFSVKGHLENKQNYEEVARQLDGKIDAIIHHMGLKG
ncbi:MAG: phospho-sugar mutase [Bacteroidetes bacterium]|nr:phospho-sugar mutase [Bacteroidota bacterium]